MTDSRTRFAATPLTLLFAVVFSGCATIREAPPTDSPIEQVREVLERQDEPRVAQLPPEIAALLLPPISLEVPRAEPERFDIDVRDVDARTFFMSLLHDTAENIVVHPDVTGSLTLSLRSVSVADVLASVRDVYGYDIRRETSGWQVFPATLQSRMFTINYINVTRDGRSETRVSSGQLRSAESSAGGSGGDEATQGSSRIETGSQSHFWRELEESLRLIVGAEGGGAGGSESAQTRAVVVNPHTGLVLVRAMPAELREVETFLRTVQSSVSRQVILEARILEVELSDGYQTGINWAALGRPGSGKTVVGGMTGGGSLLSDGVSLIAGQAGVLNPANLSMVEGTLTSAFGGAFSLALNLNDFTAFIELLQTQGDVQVLSSPRVSTINNQKAVIKVGSDEYFVTNVSSTTIGTTDRESRSEIELTPFFSGIALDVTPQISAAGDVILHIRPSVSEVTDQRKRLTVNGEQQDLPLALSSMREADSIVRASNGQIIVIGGLMQDVLRERQAGLPGLSGIPGVGHLFRHTQRTRRKTELVILLRPIVVDVDRVWDNELLETSDRVRNFYPDRPAGPR